MIFTSLHFLLYFPVVVWIHFLLPPERRWIWLLAASAYFYMAFIPIYILILLVLIAVDYSAGILIEESAGPRRRAWIVLSVAANLGMLGAFKYFNFLNENLSAALSWWGWHSPFAASSLALPIGLSFHTFQSLSYTLDVYGGRQKAERHLGIYALYVMFFPQLVAGPIERPAHLLPQLRAAHAFEAARVTEGLKLMLWGFFQKWVIADQLACCVDRVYAAPAGAPPVDLIAATAFFAVQIYCDFAGYSDIAVGAAQALGIELTRNFDRPYFSASVSEFWRRWHISLSSWFRDYVYIPLGGSRLAMPRRLFNVMAVFALSGLWHGARWSFVIWGLLHGTYVSLEILWRFFVRAGRAAGAPAAGIWGVAARLRTLALVGVAWVFFRADSTRDAVVIVERVGGFLARPEMWSLRGALGAASFPRFELFSALVGGGWLAMVQLCQGRAGFRPWIAGQRAPVRWGLYYAGVAVIMLLGRIDSAAPFIYFQF